MCGERIDKDIAAEAVSRIAAEYDIKTVMTFGGEPLLYPEAVYTIMNVAAGLDIPRRQIITNGFFSLDEENIRSVARGLAECKVNDILLSVDAFHQETIPISVVKIFAENVKKCDIPIRLSPAWLVSEDDDNLYNRKTREIIDSFRGMGIPTGVGNIVFPEGNAIKYLSEYFEKDVSVNPYVEDPYDLRCLSFSPSGDVIGDNIYSRDIMDIIRDYNPEGEKR